METLFPGSDHEMISMYHLVDDQLRVTHYCAMGNQPLMTFNPKRSTDSKLVFDFAGGSNIDPKKSDHIHSGWIKFEGKDKIEAEWAVFGEGVQKGTNRFVLERKRPSK